MSLFAGLGRSEYQDVLRGLGRLLDDEEMRACRLIEHDNGLILQARRAREPHRAFETYLLADTDIQDLLRDAYRLRGQGHYATRGALARLSAVDQHGALTSSEPAPPLFPALSHTSYQDMLRAIGRLMDREGFRNFRLIEQADGLVLQARHYGRPLRGFETYLITDDDIETLLHDSLRLRGAGELRARFPQ